MRVNVWVTLNPPEPEVDTGVSMQMCSSELSYSVLRCTPGHVRQARRYDCYEGLVVWWWCVAENAAQWPFVHNPSKSMDLLSMVCMDADRRRQTDRGRHRHGHSFHVADGVGPANKTYQNMTDQGRTEQVRWRAGKK